MPRRTTHITPTYNTSTNACGRLLRVDDGTGYQTFAYDRLGNVAENTRTIALPFEDLVAADLQSDAVEFRDFKSQYATVADCKSATTEFLRETKKTIK